jgi:hypothetical protein
MARNKGGPSGTGKPTLFPENRGDPGAGAAGLAPEGSRVGGIISRMPLWMPSGDDGAISIR